MNIENFPTERVREKDYYEKYDRERHHIDRILDAIDDAMEASVYYHNLRQEVSKKLLGSMLTTNPLRDGQNIRQLDEDLYFLEELKRRVDGMVTMYRNGRRRMTGSALVDLDNLDQRRFGDFSLS